MVVILFTALIVDNASKVYLSLYEDYWTASKVTDKFSKH